MATGPTTGAARTLGVDDPVFAAMPDLGEVADEPSHARIERWLARVLTRLSAGDRLPAEGALAAALGVSRMTLRQALAALEQRGLVERRRGRGGGTFVAAPRVECDLTGLPGFSQQVRRAHLRPGARVVEAGTVEADPTVAAALGLRSGTPVHRVVRVRSANREPLALEDTYLPAADFPGLLDHRLTGSLYTLMRRDYGLVPHHAHELLEAVTADEEQARLLRTVPGAPLLQVTRTAYTEAGGPVEHARDHWRGDRTRVALETGIARQAGAPSALRVESGTAGGPRSVETSSRAHR